MRFVDCFYEITACVCDFCREYEDSPAFVLQRAVLFGVIITSIAFYFYVSRFLFTRIAQLEEDLD